MKDTIEKLIRKNEKLKYQHYAVDDRFVIRIEICKLNEQHKNGYRQHERGRGKKRA